MPDGPYADKLRHAINTGRTGGKISYPDPAAAPLGTDEEAAGTPLSGAEVDRALRAEIRRPPQPSPENPRRGVAGGSIILVLMAMAAAGAAAWVLS